MRLFHPPPPIQDNWIGKCNLICETIFRQLKLFSSLLPSAATSHEHESSLATFNHLCTVVHFVLALYLQIIFTEIVLSDKSKWWFTATAAVAITPLLRNISNFKGDEEVEREKNSNLRSFVAISQFSFRPILLWLTLNSVSGVIITNQC